MPCERSWCLIRYNRLTNKEEHLKFGGDLERLQTMAAMLNLNHEPFISYTVQLREHFVHHW